MRQQSNLFHVVCRDCPHESLLDDHLNARQVADLHARTKGHRVHYERVDD